MNYLKYVLIVLVLMSCSDEDFSTLTNDTNILSTYIEGKAIEIGAVIACSANNNGNAEIVETYFYPEGNATNFKLFETSSGDVDPNLFSNYNLVTISDSPFFNGYLRKFTRSSTTEQWLIVTYELDGEIKLSNPIRTKNIIQPTLFSDQIIINQDQPLMPIFNWEVNSEADNAIFFEVLSTVDDYLLSGTYTFETQFQYYNTSNVVLNITEGTPPDLMLGQDYKFTIMDVSEDNWVNEVFISQFTLQ
ncbi:hypothetical protein [uncultured Winogradskyella sp.]|uniref:hypothetical protein n=1 Tax=uncultured Winogradskyella sp. TaxID=395353 RepID=UPI0026102FCA|nr:hypothetical protein [uncultured Winogradskyella sp.]